MDYMLIVPLMAFAAICLILYIMTERNFTSLMGIMGLVSGVMVWNGEFPPIFYVVSIIFIGIGLWVSVFRGDDGE